VVLTFSPFGRPSASGEKAKTNFSVDNVIFDASLNVTAVLDWEISTLGDPLTDVATMLFAHYADIDKDLGPLKGARLPIAK